MMLTIAPTWRPRLLLLVASYVGIVAAYFPTVSDMVQIWWHSSTFNHCFLIIPIAIYLVLESRPQLAGVSPGVGRAGLIYLALNAVLWSAGELVDIAFFEHLAVIGMIIGMSWLLIGPTAFRILVFPLFYLYFAVPEGEFLVPYLQDWTATVLVAMLRLSDVPVFIEGRYLSIPSGNFVVAEACSGINYLIATVSVSAMFAYLRYHSLWRRVAFMGLAVVVPLLANGLRAYGIVMIADMSDYRYAMGIDHFVYGWVFFGIVIFALFGLGNLFAETNPPPRSRGTSAVGAHDRPVGGMLALAAALLLVPRVASVQLNQTLPAAPPIALPSIAGWHEDAGEDLLGGRFDGASQVLRARYEPGETPAVQLEIHYFAAEVHGQEVINQTNAVFNNKAVQQLAYGPFEPDGVSDLAVVNEVRLRRGEREYLLWYWYDIGSQRVATRIDAKLAQARARLLRQPAGSAMIAVLTPLDDDTIAVGRDRLATFLRQAEVHLSQLYVEQ